MKERPILFNATMVRAILEGRKTQTRRIVKVQPPGEGYVLAQCVSTTGPRRNEGRYRWVKRNGHELIDCLQTYCSKPYAAGDRLWVKESFRTIHDEDNLWDCIEYADGQKIKPNVPDDVGFKFSFDCDYDNVRWRSSRFMPRWASRITIEVTGVRVNRLQDISEDDIFHEGIQRLENHSWHATGSIPLGTYRGLDEWTDNKFDYWVDPRDAYKALWDSINGPGAWEKNPWVWVVEFKRVED